MKTIKELNEKFSEYEVPSNTIDLIAWLKNSADESQNILRDYVLSNLHLDYHVEIIVGLMIGDGKSKRKFYDGKLVDATLDYKGNRQTTTNSNKTRKIINNLLSGNNEEYDDLLQYIVQIYQPDLMNSETFKKASPEHDISVIDFSQQYKQELLDNEIKLRGGKVSEDERAELERRLEDYIKKTQSQNEKQNDENRKLKDIDELLLSLLIMVNEYVETSKKIEDSKNKYESINNQMQVQSNPVISNLAKIFRPVYSAFIGSKKSIDTNLPDTSRKRGIIGKIIAQIQLASLKDKAEQSLIEERQKIGFENKDQFYDKIDSSLSKIKELCTTNYYKNYIEVLQKAMREGMDDNCLRDNLYSLTFYSNNINFPYYPYNFITGEIHGFIENNEYDFYKEPHECIERLAQDIKNNIEIGKELYSPELLKCNDFEQLCFSIRTLFSKSHINEIDGEKDSGSCQIEYRNRSLGPGEYIRDGSHLTQDEIKERMKELNLRYKKILSIGDKEEYARETADFIQDFLMLHPYSDGNGRTSRALFSVMMAQKGIVAPALIDSYEDRYDSSKFTYLGDQIAKAKNNRDAAKMKKAYKDWEDYVLGRLVKYNPDFEETVDNALVKTSTFQEYSE